MQEALGAPTTSLMKQHPDPIQLLPHVSGNLCPSPTPHRTCAHDPRSHFKSSSQDRLR